MTVKIAFLTPKGVSSIDVQLLTGARKYENITVPGTTTASALEGEVAVIVNDEASTVSFATGTAPDAATATAVAGSTAGTPVPAGQTAVIGLNKDDKINVKVSV